ncbi:MAG TPA: M4 family metallopeptidase, partial [Pilimelia sp.]|nr:M4 family metallopeptidase [Pilimelia sp.]
TYHDRGVVLDPDGRRHVRFDRTYRGLPVLGGDYVVHGNPDGSFHDATVAQREVLTVATTPAVDARTASATAARQFAGRVRKASPRLVVDARRGEPVLAWLVLVEGATPDGRAHELSVLVDARTGAVRRSFSAVHGAEPGTGHGLHVGEVPLSTTRRADDSYELVDPLRGGTQTRDAGDVPDPQPTNTEVFVDADNVWGSGDLDDRATAAVDVHYGLAEAWDYFKERHGRSGIRDDGSGAVAIVHHGGANAAWYESCFCMKFGDGDETSTPYTQLDIVAHELTHGITRATADLEYAGESGGLNEATSDIFGTLVEFSADNAADRPDYLLGEHTDKDENGPPLRYMDEPSKDGVSVSCWHPRAGDVDVHYSSGVANKFFYQLAVGSGRSSWGDSPTCGGAPPVTGIGNDKAGRIWYRALTAYLLSNSNFSAARDATLLAAADLFGAAGAEYAAVDAAWKAVNVDGSDPPQQAPAITNPRQQYGNVGDVVRMQVRATDAQGDPITFSAEGLPAELTISAAGLITGTLTTEGWDYVTITATDPAGHADQVSFFWDVIGPPVLTNPGDQTHVVGEWVTLFLNASDPDGMSLSAVGLPDGLSLYPGFDFITGVPERSGTWETTITATDTRNLSTTVSFRWTITD